MKTSEIQKIVDDWVSNPAFKVKYFPPFQMCAQLSEETGEVCREIAHKYGFKKKKSREITDGLESEIGDLIFTLACLANSENIDLGTAFQKSMDKKNNRDSKRFEK